MLQHTFRQIILFLIYKVCVGGCRMLREKYNQKTKFLVLVCLSVAIVVVIRDLF